MTDWDRTYEDLKRRNWIILLIISLLGYFFMSHSMTFGVISGGFIAIANFAFLQSIIRRAFQFDEIIKAKRIFLVVKSFFRLLILGVIIYILITRGWVDPIGLTIGLSTIVFSIVSYGISRAWKSRTEGAI